MLTIETIIGSKAGTEIRRALAVKMIVNGFETKDICEVLNVSDAFVSKWKIIYENNGAEALLVGYKGREGFLTDRERKEIIAYLQSKIHITLEEFRDYIEQTYGVLYKSKQSYYELCDAAKLSWHKSQKTNPKKDEKNVLLKRQEIKKKLHDCYAEITSEKLCVLMEDECHLLWGDTLGYPWGKKNDRIDVPITNERERQTYYAVLDVYRKEAILQAYDSGNGENTVSFVKYLHRLKEGKKLLFIWDKASYHRYSEMKTYLEEVNQGLEAKDWKIPCMFFESAAPEQNPVEDIWLKGKNFLRRHFYHNKTFHQVKESFFNFLNNQIFDIAKLAWYF